MTGNKKHDGEQTTNKKTTPDNFLVSFIFRSTNVKLEMTKYAS